MTNIVRPKNIVRTIIKHIESKRDNLVLCSILFRMKFEVKDNFNKSRETLIFLLGGDWFVNAPVKNLVNGNNKDTINSIFHKNTLFFSGSISDSIPAVSALASANPSKCETKIILNRTKKNNITQQIWINSKVLLFMWIIIFITKSSYIKTFRFIYWAKKE